MSNALAVATVTQALALLIESNLGPEMDIAVKVETGKPPNEPPGEPTVTVFLYQVTPNPSMRNVDLPARSSDGTLVKRPVAALDLHYLISAYGEEAELVGQRLIGCVIRTLHEIPVLPRELIELAAERPYLAGSDLAESPQKVRFTPTVMDIDETSKLWGMLHQTPYSLSVAYQASLVLLEGRERPTPAKPVEERTVRVLPFGAPGAPVPPGAGSPAGAAATAEADEPVGADASAASAPEPDTSSAPTERKAPAKRITRSAPAKRTAPAHRARKEGGPQVPKQGGKS
ncbi:DUF4255 domain-containing protein [Streptomyces sp. ISL-10]|uniref:DUF4255 domain-containing protein n=1 Tax=Streptomyces sp. ISL-10 TaxID=2819172 RepID=UPI001BE91D7C|nr:DUF4255 domain-containing protein [Streptomyces sp. ISL-10]MBT2367456.1 DUF4255 domain-containing protein [Streptomyces sp. ISL-10]